MAGNTKANVSTTRGVKGGYIFSAPVGTSGAPTASTFLPTQWLTNGNPPTGWECLGFIPEDGFTETVDLAPGDPLRDINLDTIDQGEGSPTESLTVQFMEVKAHTLGTTYGHDNVTDANGVISVAHNWSNFDEHYQYVFLLLFKNSRHWTKYIPDGKVTEIGDLEANKTTVAQRELTISYNTDESGNGCFDWYESTETPAPALSTLSVTGTGISLSPAFSATVTEYAAETTGNSATVTATAASGYTVAITDANGNAYNSGGSVPMVSGTNKVFITVTHTETGAKGVYTVTITK